MPLSIVDIMNFTNYFSVLSHIFLLITRMAAIKTKGIYIILVLTKIPKQAYL